MKSFAGLMLLFTMTAVAAQPAPAAAPASQAQAQAQAQQSMAWVAVNGQASGLAVGADGAVFAIDPEGQVWLRRSGKEGAWTRLPGDFRRIAAVSERRAWAIAEDGSLYVYNGSWWRSMSEFFAFKAQDIAASGAGQVFAVGSDGVLRELDEQRGVRMVTDAPANLKRVSLDENGLPWVIGRDGNVRRFDGAAWSDVGALRAAEIAATHGDIWIVDQDGQLLTLDAGGGAPRQVAAGASVVASAPGGVPWIATADGRIYAQRVSGPQIKAVPPAPAQVFTRLLNWKRVNGSARQLAISPSGAILALGRDGEVWNWKGRGQWGRLPGSFSRLALDSANVPWGIRIDGRIMQYQGSYWREMPGSAREIATGADGSVWIVQADGQAAQWQPRERRWELLPAAPKLRQLAIGPQGELWAIAQAGGVVRRVGEQWEPLPEIDAVDLAIGPEGSVFVTSADQRLLRWDSAGKRWESLNGTVAAVAVGPRGHPWVTTPEFQILASAFFDDLPDSQVNTTSLAAANAAAASPQVGFGSGVGAGVAVVGQPGVGGGAPRGRDNEPLEYRKVNGKARDIAIGAEGSVFIIAYDSSLARWSNTRNAFVPFAGQFARVAVAPDGKPWGITAGGEVFRHDGSAWQLVRNIKARDIGIGFDGTVIIVDTQGFLQRYNRATNAFARLPVDANGVPPSGSRVAVTPNGKPWVITGDGFVARCEKAACERLPVKARSISIGPEGSVIIVDADRVLRRWHPRQESFERIDGIQDLTDLAAVGPRGKPWLLSTSAEVWASEFFPRDERGDVLTAAVTQARINSGMPAPPTFSFTVNMTFEKLNDLGPPLILSSELGAVQLAINPSTGRATLIDAENRLFNYNEVSKTLVRDMTIPAPPPMEQLRSFFIGRDGSYWLTSGVSPNARIWRYQSNQWTMVPGNWGTMLAHRPISVAEAVDGTVYASGPDGQLYRYDKSMRRFLRVTMPLPGGQISVVAIDLNGHLWVGSEGPVPGIYEQTGGTWALRMAGAGFIEDCTEAGYTCFALGGNGSVYTVNPSDSLRRLQRWNSTSGFWERIGNAPNVSNHGLFAVGKDGRPWVVQRNDAGAGSGLYRAR